MIMVWCDHFYISVSFFRSQSQVGTSAASIGSPRPLCLPVHDSPDEKWPHHVDAHLHGGLLVCSAATGQSVNLQSENTYVLDMF